MLLQRAENTHAASWLADGRCDLRDNLSRVSSHPFEGDLDMVPVYGKCGAPEGPAGSTSIFKVEGGCAGCGLLASSLSPASPSAHTCPSRFWERSILRRVAWKRFLMALGERPGIILASTAHWFPTLRCKLTRRRCSCLLQGLLEMPGCR